MKKRKIIIFYIIAISIISVSLLGITYGYVRTNITGNDDAKSFTALSQNLKINYTDNKPDITVNEAFIPGKTISKTFTLTSESSKNLIYSLIIEDLKHEFIRNQDITYELYENNTLLTSGIMPDSNQIEWILHTNLELGINESKTYNLKILYNNSTDNQIIDQGKTISGKISVRE